MGVINDTWGSSSLSNFSKSYTLDDLEKDDEFQNTSERFLESVGEKSDDVFEYLRDSDFNLFSGMNRAMESGKFNEEQKKDYAYLRSKFDNADMGSFKQYVELIKDAGIDIATDPTAILAAVATPITGGTSFISRKGIALTFNQTAKAIAKNKLKDTPIPKEDMVKLGKKQIQKATAITGAEVGAWTGLDNHFRQNTEINVDLRKLYSTPELVGSAALGAITGGVFGNLAQRHRLYNEDLNRLFTNDEYRKDAGSELMFQARKAKDTLLANTVGNPTRILRTTSEYAPVAKELGEKFSEEFSKQIGKRTTRRLGFSFSEDLNNTRGNFLLDFDAAVKPIRKTGEITKDNELAVIRILRGASTKGASNEVKETVLNLRKFYDRILKEAEDAGLEAPRIEDYFPRSWNRQAIEEDIPAFKKLLLSENVDGVTNKNVDDVIEQMLDKQNELYSSHSILLTQARTFKNLKDNNFEKYLTNDLIPVTTNYYMGAAKSIEHKKSFLLPGKTNKSNEDQFIERYITPMNSQLRKVRGKGLAAKDKKRIINLYKSVTGQVDYFDSGLIQGIYDTTKLANAMAYLPLATLSSVTEAFIPLAKAPLSSNIKGMQSAVTKGHKIFTTEIGSILKEKHNMKPDEIVQEMNRVFIAVDEAMGDVTNRISGEGLQNEFLKKQARRFYRFNLLVPWTKTVQLAAFSTGKDLIRDNLTKLNKFKSGGEDILSEIAPMKIQKLRSELFDLGIEIEDGIKWLDAGAKQSDAFYNEQLVRGAGRFTNSIILPTARESARVPTYMTNPKIDIFTQFLRYPTVFGNTILKNFARDTLNNPATNAPKVAAFVAMSTNVAKATNYWRTSEENRERMDSGEDDWKDTLKAYQRVGLLGPIEYGVRFTEALAYGQNPAIATANLGGPVINDIVGVTFYNRGLLETAARKLPLVTTKNLMKKYTGFEPYTPIQNVAKERDKKNRTAFEKYAEIATGTEEVVEGFSERFGKLEGFRSNFNKGGRVGYAEGLGVSKNVSDVKNEPENRVDPFTGQPYAVQTQALQPSLGREIKQDQMTRLGFEEGGIVTPEENRLGIYSYLENKQVRPEAIVGIMANIDKETGVESNKWRGSYSHKQQEVGNSKLGQGLFQFTTKLHKEGYGNFLKDNNLGDSNEANLEYFLDTVINPQSKMREQIGGRNLDELRDVFEKGNVQEITEAINNKWLKPKSYGEREQNPEAHLNNLNDRNFRANRIVEELNLFKD